MFYVSQYNISNLYNKCNGVRIITDFVYSNRIDISICKTYISKYIASIYKTKKVLLQKKYDKKLHYLIKCMH